MKKVLSVLLIAVLMLSLFSACGGSTESAAPESEAPASAAPESETPESEAPESEEPEASSWKPEQQVEIIAPFSPGGSTDLLARAVEAVWPKYCDQPLVITNMPGGGGITGAMAVASSEPDGYTLEIGFGSGHDITMPYLQQLDYDPYELLDPVCLLSEHVTMIGVVSDSEFQSMTDVVEWAEETGGTITVSTATINATTGLTAKAIAATTGPNMNIVPHDGPARAVTDLLSGSFMLCAATSSDFAPYVESGQIRVIAVASAERDPAMPDVPTLVEQGIDYSVYGSLKGIAVPKNTPDEIKQYYEQLFADITSDEQFIELMQELVQPVTYMGTDEFTQYFDDVTASYKTIIEDLGLAYYEQ